MNIMTKMYAARLASVMETVSVQITSIQVCLVFFLQVNARLFGEVVQKDCQARNLNREDVMDRSRWKKLMRLDDDQNDGWVNVSSGTGSPG